MFTRAVCAVAAGGAGAGVTTGAKSSNTVPEDVDSDNAWLVRGVAPPGPPGSVAAAAAGAADDPPSLSPAAAASHSGAGGLAGGCASAGLFAEVVVTTRPCSCCHWLTTSLTRELAAHTLT